MDILAIIYKRQDGKTDKMIENLEKLFLENP